MSEIPNFAPGCFGSALAYQEDHQFCKSCKFAEQCKPLHERNLAILRQRCNVRDKPKRFEIAKTTEENPYPSATILTDKIQAYIDRIENSGIRITEAFAKGENPFKPSSLKFLHVAAHILLRLKQPLRPEILAQAYMGHLKCSQNTADFYARTAFQIFRHVGAVDEIDGGYRLRSL